MIESSRSIRVERRSHAEVAFSDLRTEDAVFNRTSNTWNKATGVGRWLRVLGVGAALAATLPGCLAHARGELVYDHPVTYVEAAPARVETYPRTYYRGSPAYLVDDRWYYQSRGRWVYFREEPVELRDYRARHYASPRYREQPRRYSEVIDDRRGERYRDARREARHREERLGTARAEQRRAEQRRAEHYRAEQRRESERRADRRRHDERREAEARKQSRRAEHYRNENREAERRIAERRAEQRRDERKDRVAEKRPRDDRRRDRNRDGDRDERRNRND